MPTLQIKTGNAPFIEAKDWADRTQVEPQGAIPSGAIVEYHGHLVGGMVAVRYEGKDVVIHPAATVELSESK